ncbi:FAD-binding oxidoreductase [Candidatus Endolissoclinum faulkneri]|nr:FAD-binding oxidoreductase [Candidatus Endolissoclinum faulkneri]
MANITANRPDFINVLERIKQVVGPKGWTNDLESMLPYMTDWRGICRAEALMVVRPKTTEEIAKLVTLCAEGCISIIPQGGNTSLCGGSIPLNSGEEIIVSLARMNKVLNVDPDNYTITVEAGCILKDLQNAASKANRYFPLSLAAEGSAMIGGNLSTNAGGTNVLRYGNARDLVLGLEVVLADGRIWNGLRGLRKDNTGYDLKHLFLGSEGTLGIITAAVLKIFPKPTEVCSAFCAVPNVDAAVTLLGIARAESGDAVETFELMPRLMIDLVMKHIADCKDPLKERYDFYVLIELVSSASVDSGISERLESILSNAFESGLVIDAAIAQNETQRQAFWKLRENASESQRIEGASIKNDISVPVSRIAEFYDTAWIKLAEIEPNIRLVAFGHIGDGNLHYNLQISEHGDKNAFLARYEEFSRVVNEIVVEMGGSISAEHGIGRFKRKELAYYKDKVSMDLMGSIKNSMDPAGILNPGKVV